MRMTVLEHKEQNIFANMVWFFKPVRSFVVYYGHFVIFASPINRQMMGQLYVILLYKGDWVGRLV